MHIFVLSVSVTPTNGGVKPFGSTVTGVNILGQLLLHVRRGGVGCVTFRGLGRTIIYWHA
jgi:hypothetical protein